MKIPSAAAFKAALIGSWQLTYYSTTSSTNSSDVTFPMTDNPIGLILYTPDGYMSAQLMAPPGSPPGGPEGGFLGLPYLGYSGAYRVESTKDGIEVYHTMEVASYGGWLGNTQLRLAEMTEERVEDGKGKGKGKGKKVKSLVLSSPPADYDGDIRVPRLVWRRAEDVSK